MNGDWALQQASAFPALQGHCPLVAGQLLTLRMTLAIGAPMVITTYQDDVAFRLAIGTSSNWPTEEPGAGYRLRTLLGE